MTGCKKWLKCKKNKLPKPTMISRSSLTEVTQPLYENEYMANNASTSKIVPQPSTPVSGLKKENEINNFDTINDYTIHKSDSYIQSSESKKILNVNLEDLSNIEDNLCCKSSDAGTNTSYDFNKCENSFNGSNRFHENDVQINKQPLSNKTSDTTNLNIENNKNPRASLSKLEFVCSLYVTACPTIVRPGDEKREPVNYKDLEKAIQFIKPIGSFKVSETKCGLIATFTHELDADNLLLNLNLAQALHGPVQVARFSRRDARYKQIATLRDVPWSIPMQDICTALTFQARFLAVPERWYRNSRSNSAANDGHDTDSVLQCYRCQGFWHVAANCRHLPRCVRCGEPHGVEFCPRPRNNPICCHCSGAHHAAYKSCPVRVQLMNAIPVSMSLSTTRSISQSRETRSRCRS
ncbi:uncharacterized protein LOC123294005 isoform X2 [Chrysoperla carnea]|uniref:uncharacterized protein LOC123294005 isoform X2 n=1 Tax=Chrysoperla carnea TaxID=189513 RepID=UPI001D098683|nr:uncharacterized protein LOC123294005 isoform X2 [Chrysoperla carnea]